MNSPLRRLATVVAVLFVALMIGDTCVQFVQADSLNTRPGNARSLYKEYGRERGPIVVAGTPIAESVKVDDAYGYQRKYPRGQLYSDGHRVLLDRLRRDRDGVRGRRPAAPAPPTSCSTAGSATCSPARQPQGAAVELTINPKAQQAAWDALGDQRGAVVALDPATGNILAMVSKPAFDPNLLAGHDTKKVRAPGTALLADPNRPLDNRAIAGRLYPPGSTFKLITAAAALERVATPRSPWWTVRRCSTCRRPVSGCPTTSRAPAARVARSRCWTLCRISCNTAFGALGLDLGGAALRGAGTQVRVRAGTEGAAAGDARACSRPS